MPRVQLLVAMRSATENERRSELTNKSFEWSVSSQQFRGRAGSPSRPENCELKTANSELSFGVTPRGSATRR